MSMSRAHKRQWMFFGFSLIGCVLLGCVIWSFIVWEPPDEAKAAREQWDSSIVAQHANDPPPTTFPESLAPQVVWSSPQLGLAIYCDNQTAIYKWNGEMGVVVPNSDKCQPR